MRKTQNLEMLPLYTLVIAGVALVLMFLLVVSTINMVSRRATTRVLLYPPTPQSQQRPNQPNESVQSSVSIIEPTALTQKVDIAQ